MNSEQGGPRWTYFFLLRQLQENAVEQRQPLYRAFVDFKKAFDTVSRSVLWRVLQRAGRPEKFINIVKEVHDDMTATAMAGVRET